MVMLLTAIETGLEEPLSLMSATVKPPPALLLETQSLNVTF